MSPMIQISRRYCYISSPLLILINRFLGVKKVTSHIGDAKIEVY